MLIFKHSHFHFLRCQFGPRLIELIFEKAGRVLRAFLPLLQVLRNKKISELGGGCLCHLWIAIHVVNIERGKLLVVTVGQLNFNVFAHDLNQIVRALVLVCMGIEAERVDNAKQTGATQDLLRDAIKLTLDVVIDIRLYILFRNRRLFNQD